MSVWSSAGGLSRAASELGVVKVEQQRMLRNNNTIISTRMSEQDARSAEMEEDMQGLADKGAKAVSTSIAEAAAVAAVFSSCARLVSAGVDMAKATNLSQLGELALKAAPGLVSGIFGVIMAVMDLMSADEEADIASADAGRMKAHVSADAKAVKALDANPYA